MVAILIQNKIFFETDLEKYEEIVQLICKRTDLQPYDFYLTQNGRKLNDVVNKTLAIHFTLRTCGGKGGFGSMLRAIGAQIEKTTNREACRDLSGRRLRDINEEKRLKSWLEKQGERERAAEEKKKRKIEKLLAVPRHEFKDEEYEEARSKLTEKVNDAVEEGFKKETQEVNLPSTSAEAAKNLKRKTNTLNAVAIKKKKSALWIGDDISDSSDDNDSDDSDSDNNYNSTKSATNNKEEAKPKITLAPRSEAKSECDLPQEAEEKNEGSLKI